jgi:hypothetical protein
LTIEILFVLATGLIKVSILLFFRRLGSRGVSKTFRVITWAAIGFTIASTITFFVSPLLGCRPLSAYWEQSDVVKIIQGTKFNCNDEGAAMAAAGIVSTVQDVITALLPNFIYWKAQIPFRQKAALMGIFATAYGVAAFGALRTYATWVLFFETYLELHIGVICANAPALKVFVKRYLDIKSVVSKQQSRFPWARSSQAESSRAKSSQPKSSQTRSQTSSNLSGKSRGKLAMWKNPYANHGYYSQPTQLSVDEQSGVRISEEFEEKESRIEPVSEDSTRSERHYPNDDVELGILPNHASHVSRPPQSHRGSRGLISLYYYDSDSESETAGGGFKYRQVKI